MSTPRIISGSAKGMHLKDVPGDSTRPITDRVKEALFNIIGQDVPNERFLDLFGGTGSVGIEALSRGAAYVQFIENNPKAYQILQENLRITKLMANSQVTLVDAFNYLRKPLIEAFFIIYVAPPQYKGIWKKALIAIDENCSILDDEGLVIAQIHPIEYEKLNLSSLIEFDQRKYGSTTLIFYEKTQKL